MTPGRPFWTGFTAFSTNMVALLGLDKLNATNIQRPWLAAIVASLFVAAAVYGREKLVEAREQRP
jgi:hypothetical protein